jgi:hypothetical protein
MVLVGHHCAMTGRHRLALGEYFRAYRRMPSNALLSLLIGCTYLQKVLSRRCPNSHEYVMRAFTFLFQYQSAAWAQTHPTPHPIPRSFCSPGRSRLSTAVFAALIPQLRAPVAGQEATYNLARAFHQIGLLNFAHFY